MRDGYDSRSCSRTASGVALAEAEGIARAILELGTGAVILKLGENGAWLVDERRSQHFPGRYVKAVDVTAAGDTFNAALAVALSEGHSLEDAILFANTAASISVTRSGAQASVPWRSEVERLIEPQQATWNGNIQSPWPCEHRCGTE